jgi:peroxiredoxin
MMRALIRFERWDDLLNEKTFEWKDSTQHKAFKAYTQTIAYLAKGEREKAEKAFADHKALKADAEKIKGYSFDQNYAIQALELKGRLELAAGHAIDGLATLTEAAAKEDKLLDQQNDPPFYPVYIPNLLGNAYLQQRSPALAVQAYQRTLNKVRGDGFALAGLVEAYSMLGDKQKAANAMGRLLYVWGDADSGLKPLERARQLVPNAQPIDSDAPAKQRNYIRTSLEKLGPNVWQDFPAPTLDVTDAKGKQVTLDQYKGKNVLLIFYLGSECAHCIDQLKLVAKKKLDLAGLDTEVLAVSSASVDTNAASQKVGDLPFSLLSDKNFANARRFKSYDDFEDLELHSTMLIDKQGRIHWSRTGGDPFTDVDFLLKELGRMNRAAAPGSSTGAGQP